MALTLIVAVGAFYKKFLDSKIELVMDLHVVVFLFRDYESAWSLYDAAFRGIKLRDH